MYFLTLQYAVTLYIPYMQNSDICIASAVHTQ